MTNERLAEIHSKRELQIQRRWGAATENSTFVDELLEEVDRLHAKVDRLHADSLEYRRRAAARVSRLLTIYKTTGDTNVRPTEKSVS